MSNEAFRVAVGMRLGTRQNEPHTCSCGSFVDVRGLHGLSCRRSAERHIRHSQLNDIIWRSLCRAQIPSPKEPLGLIRSDGKRPDGVTLLPWSYGKCLTWDVTVPDTMTTSHMDIYDINYGRCSTWHSDSQQDNRVCSTQITTHFVLNTYVKHCSSGNRIYGIVEPRQFEFRSQHRQKTNIRDRRSTGNKLPFQRLSVTIRRGNELSFAGTHPDSDCWGALPCFYYDATSLSV